MLATVNLGEVFSSGEVLTLGLIPNLGPLEIGVVLLLGLLLFGRRLPEVGRNVGRSIIEFKRGLRDVSNELEAESKRDSARASAPSSAPSSAPASLSSDSGSSRTVSQSPVQPAAQPAAQPESQPVQPPQSPADGTKAD